MTEPQPSEEAWETMELLVAVLTDIMGSLQEDDTDDILAAIPHSAMELIMEHPYNLLFMSCSMNIALIQMMADQSDMTPEDILRSYAMSVALRQG